MNEEEIIMNFIKWTHDKCFTLEGLVDSDLKHMIRMYLKEKERESKQ